MKTYVSLFHLSHYLFLKSVSLFFCLLPLSLSLSYSLFLSLTHSLNLSLFFNFFSLYLSHSLFNSFTHTLSPRVCLMKRACVCVSKLNKRLKSARITNLSKHLTKDLTRDLTMRYVPLNLILKKTAVFSTDISNCKYLDKL